MSDSTGPSQAALDKEARAWLAGRFLPEPVPSSRAAGSSSEAQARGFTLLELLAAVVIVMTIAAASIPLATRLVHRSEDAEDARRLASAISNARALAMGRGSSVLVRYGDGMLFVREAVLGPDAECKELPQLGCERPTLWDSNVRSREVERVDASRFKGTVAAATGGGAPVTHFGFCFNPSGQTYADTTGTGVWSRATGATVISFSPTAKDLQREVVVLPNGATRVISKH